MSEPSATAEPKAGRCSPDWDRPNMSDLKIVLLGKSVSENSKVGNFILGRAAFGSEAPPDVVKRVGGRLKDRHMILINSPQLLQTNISDHQITQTVRECVSLSDPGPHVFMIILQYNDFTEEDMRRVEYVLKEFSEEAIKHTIVITTDEMAYDAKGAPVRVNDFIQKLSDECGGGHLQFDTEIQNKLSEISQQFEKILREYHGKYHGEQELSVDEDQSSCGSLRTEEEEEVADVHDDGNTNETAEKGAQVTEGSPKHDQAKRSNQRIVLLGKNVSENNKVGNFILGTDVFESKPQSAESKLHQRTQRVGGRLKDRYVSIIISPQLLQPHLSLYQISQMVRECVDLSYPGPHAFILVLQNKDFTEKDIINVKRVLKEFSEEAMKHTIVITTDEQTLTSMFSSVIRTNVIKQLVKECGGGHLHLDGENPKWHSEILKRVDKIVKENREDFLTLSPNVPDKQKLNLVLCGSDGSLKDAASKVLQGKNISSSYLKTSTEVCVMEEEIHSRLVNLISLPALSRLSEEEVMRQTLHCVSLCHPGVHVFIIVIPVGPLTDGDKTEMEKIKKIFDCREHFILLFTTELSVEGFASDFVELRLDCQTLISLYGGQYRVMGLKEPENSRQIPDLLDYIEKMKTEPFSLQMFVKAQENRARRETEEKHRKQLSEMEKKIKELEEKIQSEGAKTEDNQGCLRIVLIGKTGSGKSATGNSILGRNEFVSKSRTDSVTTVCKKRVGEVEGRSVAVVDTPGLFDTELTNEHVMEEIMKCVSLSSPGPHVFVIVLSVGRLTKEETDTVDLIKKIFGPKAAQFSIVLFTRGDELEDHESIQDYVRESKSAELQKLIRDCGNRFLAFNNKEKQDKTQVIQLLNMIEEMKNSNQGRYFSNSMFEEAEMSIRKKMEEIMKEKEREIQAENEKLKVKYETETEELKKRLEEEKRKADDERKHRENEFRQKQEKLMKEYEEKHKAEQEKREMENQKRSEEEKQQRAEYNQKIEEMKREMENQRSLYEKQQKEREEEDRKREEKYKRDQEKMTLEQERILAEVQRKQEEEIKKRELEEKQRNEEEEEERQRWKIKIKHAENERKETQEEIKRQQREWEDDKKRQMKEREEEERKRKEKHEEQLREKQEELEKMRKRFEREREEERQKIEEERQKERREREEKEREYEEKKQETKRHYEQLERERKEEWERRKREDDERREEERKRCKKEIEDLKQKQEEEIKRREREEKERKEREEKERYEMKKKHEEEMKEMKKKHEDEARKQAEELNEFKEGKEKLQQKLEEHQKQHQLLEELHQHLKDQKDKEMKELQDELEKLCQNQQVQKEKELNQQKKQAEALKELLKDQTGENIKALQEEFKQFYQILEDQKGDQSKLQEEAEKLCQSLQDKKEKYLKEIREKADKMKKKPWCFIQ